MGLSDAAPPIAELAHTSERWRGDDYPPMNNDPFNLSYSIDQTYGGTPEDINRLINMINLAIKTDRRQPLNVQALLKLEDRSKVQEYLELHPDIREQILARMTRYNNIMVHVMRLLCHSNQWLHKFDGFDAFVSTSIPSQIVVFPNVNDDDELHSRIRNYVNLLNNSIFTHNVNQRFALPPEDLSLLLNIDNVERLVELILQCVNLHVAYDLLLPYLKLIQGQPQYVPSVPENVLFRMLSPSAAKFFLDVPDISDALEYFTHITSPPTSLEER